MKKTYFLTVPVLSVLAGHSMAGVVAGTGLPVVVGDPVGNPLGSVVSAVVGQSVPVGIGGVAALASISLIIGIQLIKRKKK